jgi:hypothetical protein
MAPRRPAPGIPWRCCPSQPRRRCRSGARALRWRHLPCSRPVHAGCHWALGARVAPGAPDAAGSSSWLCGFPDRQEPEQGGAARRGPSPVNSDRDPSHPAAPAARALPSGCQQPGAGWAFRAAVARLAFRVAAITFAFACGGAAVATYHQGADFAREFSLASFSMAQAALPSPLPSLLPWR